MATGNFAKDTEAEEVTGYGLSDGPTTTDNNGATSSASKTNKAKISGNDDNGLIAAFKSVGESLSNAIKVVANPDNVPEGLFESLTKLPGFEPTHISLYYAYLVTNPNMAFMGLPFEFKLNWVALFVSEKFPGQ